MLDVLRRFLSTRFLLTDDMADPAEIQADVERYDFAAAVSRQQSAALYSAEAEREISNHACGVFAGRGVAGSGRNVLLAAQVGIAGSTTIEDAVTLAGQVGVSGHITIGKGTIATAQTGIPNSVEPGSFISGYPAINNRDWLKSSAVFRRLPELRKTIADLHARLAEIESRLK